MSDYQPAQVGYFLRSVELFPFTPETDTAHNSIIIPGKLIGCVYRGIEAGDTFAQVLLYPPQK
ncbi:MAG: hypothetical protein IJD43_13330 [Thermoguttaceae bacterium]|nr:hypothetical protein [Thermoguttaceae bacterium]